MRKTCKECWHWKKSGNDNYPLGQCRTHSPVAIKDGYEEGCGCPTTCWPETLPNDYCGDFAEVDHEATQ